jgi:hypothetical protein
MRKQADAAFSTMLSLFIDEKEPSSSEKNVSPKDCR